MRSHKVELYPRNSGNPYDFEIVGRRFDEVHATSTSGSDYVRMHDTPDVELLMAGFVQGENFASLSTPVNANDMALMYDAIGFGVVRAENDYGETPKNQKDVDDAVDFLLLSESHWDDI